LTVKSTERHREALATARDKVAEASAIADIEGHKRRKNKIRRLQRAIASETVRIEQLRESAEAGKKHCRQMVNECRKEIAPIIQQLLCPEPPTPNETKAYTGKPKDDAEGVIDPEADREKEESKGGYGEGAKGEGDGVLPSMAVRELELTDRCDPSAPVIQTASSGARLNRSRIVSALISRNTRNLFVRRRSTVGGCIVIDASGSMEITHERLERICRAVPQGTVAFYSDKNYDNELNVIANHGSLTIYARGGRRAPGIPDEYIGGGNGVDLPALEWLLEQDGPRTFVSDGHFCGGDIDDDTKAMQLLIQAKARGDCEWLESTSELEKSLGLQGDE